MKTTLSGNGEIQLPPEIQTQLGLKPGDEVILETQNGHCIIRPSAEVVGLDWEGNVLVHRGISNASVDAVVDEIRKQRLDQFGGGVIP